MNTKEKKLFDELCIGYGYEEFPKELRSREDDCCGCSLEDLPPTRRKLYTTLSLIQPNSTRAYSSWICKVRNNLYCNNCVVHNHIDQWQYNEKLKTWESKDE